MIQQLPEQKTSRYARNFVDADMLGEKQNAKSFRSAAYTLGIAIAFLILSLILPTFEDKRVADMVELIRSLSFWMLGYGLVIVFSYIKMRKSMKYVRFMLTWFLAPTIGLWFILRVMDIFSNMPPELQS